MSRGSSGTGHYTQLVWAETDRIGCGSVYYRGTLFFICFVFLLKLAGNTSGLRYGGQNLLALPIFSTKKQQSFHEIQRMSPHDSRPTYCLFGSEKGG